MQQESVSFTAKKLNNSQVIGDADSDNQSHHVVSNLLSSAITVLETHIK